ncbi:MAG: hypothetical protein IKB73_00560 [Ruminococcus sp.]|nr:hypothetical protein [Ruminococcus sp.]
MNENPTPVNTNQTTPDNNKKEGGCTSTIVIIAIIIFVIAFIASRFEDNDTIVINDNSAKSSSSSSSSMLSDDYFDSVNNYLDDNSSSYVSSNYSSSKKYSSSYSTPKKNTDSSVDANSHYLMKYDNKGDCKKLTGNIAMTFVFVDDQNNIWSDQDVKEMQALQNIYIANITSQAKDYGFTINITPKYFRAYSLTDIKANNHNEWIDTTLSSARLPVSDSMGGYLENLYYADEAPVLFFINKPGQSYYVKSDANNDTFEYAVIFSSFPDFRPQLYSMYGCIDYNESSSVRNCASKYFPDSLMLECNSFAFTDSLNAYILGWTSSLDNNAISFLNETSYQY